MPKARTTREDELLVVTGISVAYIYIYIYLIWQEVALSDQLIS